jgi:3-oxoacyl-[acyl-carrier protein] reductase
MSVRNKVVLVTGATRGIGNGVARRLAAEGATVAVNGRNPTSCDEAVVEIGHGSFAVPGDVGSTGTGNELVDKVLDRAGRIDVLINNAGIALDNFATGVTDERWEQTLATNLSGPMYLIRAAVRPMKAQGGGVIINMTSWAGIRGNVGQAAYSASKAGLYGLTLTCAKELGKFGIRVNAIAPAVQTDIAAEMPEHLKERSAQRTPLKIKGTVDDVAEAVLFLASDSSRFITGQLLNVDGGMHLT